MTTGPVVVSVNVGRPRTVTWRDHKVTTAIWLKKVAMRLNTMARWWAFERITPSTWKASALTSEPNRARSTATAHAAATRSSRSAHAGGSASFGGPGALGTVGGASPTPSRGMPQSGHSVTPGRNSASHRGQEPPISSGSTPTASRLRQGPKVIVSPRST